MWGNLLPKLHVRRKGFKFEYMKRVGHGSFCQSLSRGLRFATFSVSGYERDGLFMHILQVYTAIIESINNVLKADAEEVFKAQLTTQSSSR